MFEIHKLIVCVVAVTTFVSVVESTSLDPTPVDSVSSDCLCDLTGNACDVNCFCDPDCTELDRSTFDQPLLTRKNDDNACVRKDLILTDNSEFVTTENTNEDVFCLWKDNYEARNFFKSVPQINDVNQFDSYLSQYTDQVLQVQTQLDLTAETEPYKFGSDIFVIRSSNEIGEMSTLGPAMFSNTCTDNNKLKYLEETSQTCQTAVTDLATQCTADASFSLGSYFQNFKVIQVTDFFTQVDVNNSVDLDTIYDTNGNLVPVEISCITLSGVSDVCNETLAVDIENSVYLSSTYDAATEICSNVVEKLNYKILYGDGSSIERVLLEVSLVDLTAATTTTTAQQLVRSVEVAFTEDLNATTVARSGNPGFIRGYPIPKAFLFYDSNEDTLVMNSLDGAPYLSVVKPNTGTCLSSNPETVNVAFGYNTVSGCKIEVQASDFESDATCQALQDTLVASLLGNIPTQADGNNPKSVIDGGTTAVDSTDPNLYIARFGNTESSQPGDWIEVFFSTDEPNARRSIGRCTLVSTIKLDILYANVGELELPQAKIVGARYSYITSSHQFQCGLQCSGTDVKFIQGQVIVNFIDVSEDSEGAIKKIPPIETDLPYDFFYPFLVNSSPTLHFRSTLNCSFILILLNAVLIMTT